MKSMKWLFKRLVQMKSIKWIGYKKLTLQHILYLVFAPPPPPFSNIECNASKIFAITWQRVRVSLVLWIYLVLANCAVAK